jgi:cob(I)alamin adenosyltransferase
VTGGAARRGSAQGDEGYTDLLGGRRVPKHHPILEALGELDTATSALGLAKRTTRQPRTRTLLHQMQADLYEIMAELSFPPDHAQAQRITQEHVAWLDRTLAAVQAPFAQLRAFVLPGASDASAALDLARAQVRTAERRLTRLHHDGDLKNALALTYVNRLSLVLYYLARAEDAAAGVDTDLAGAPTTRPEA